MKENKKNSGLKDEEVKNIAGGAAYEAEIVDVLEEEKEALDANIFCGPGGIKAPENK